MEGNLKRAGGAAARGGRNERWAYLFRTLARTDGPSAPSVLGAAMADRQRWAVIGWRAAPNVTAAAAPNGQCSLIDGSFQPRNQSPIDRSKVRLVPCKPSRCLR